MDAKSSVDEIRQRFDNDVERFSNLQTGQSATIDAPVALELIAQAAALTTPDARHLLDVGCGAGNYALKLLQYLPNRDVTLVDLSKPMLDRAVQRVISVTTGAVLPLQADIRTAAIADASVDIILAAAVLHHLRTDDEWSAVFSRFYRMLRPGGSVWIFDLVQSSIPALQEMMRRRYGQYLANLKNEAYRDSIFTCIEKEDTPRPLLFQIDALKNAGFGPVEILHLNSGFAAFGALRQ